jgi:hypothetical protein
MEDLSICHYLNLFQEAKYGFWWILKFADLGNLNEKGTGRKIESETWTSWKILIVSVVIGIQ